ncbi:hypothetical protein IW262DRAFT_323938 [Armillaria fumosa]|nr:hypothetical protein IW262DRAFT_323938 [Armillaria fumosa]
MYSRRPVSLMSPWLLTTMIPFFAIFLSLAWFTLVDGRLSSDEGPIFGIGVSVVVHSSFSLTRIVRIWLSVRFDGSKCIRLLIRVLSS